MSVEMVRGKVWLVALCVIAGAALSTSASGNERISHEAQSVTVGNTRLNYIDWRGTGPVLILVAGPGVSPHVFDDLAPAFTDRFRVISYARHGGDRPEAMPQYDSPAPLEGLRSLMDALGVESADLAGWSRGGIEITEMAVKYPHRVRHIIYLDFFDSIDPAYTAAPGLARRGVWDMPTEALASFDAYRAYAETVLYPGIDDIGRVRDYLLDSYKSKVADISGFDMARATPTETSERFGEVVTDYPNMSEVRCPVLSIFARSVFDPDMPDAALRKELSAWELERWAPFREEAKRRVKRALPTARLLTVRGSHENFFVMSRDQVVDAIRQFLGADEKQDALADLDTYIEKALEDFEQVGAAVAVVQGGQTAYAKGFGLREAGTTAKVDADTLFEIGSVTKSFTAAALGMLVDEGKIAWDDPIGKYLPGFQLSDPWLTQHMTVRDALSHRSGIVESPYFVLAAMDKGEALQQLRYATSIGQFRDSFGYSNLMYAAAGDVLEAAIDGNWHTFVGQRLLAPLGMSRSTTSPYRVWDARFVAPAFLGSSDVVAHFNDASDENVAMPHARTDDGSVVVLPWRSYDNSAAAGSIISSATDMAQWLLFQLGDGKQLLSRDTLRTIHTTQNLHAGVNRFPFGDGAETYALGWFRSDYRDRVHLAHTGGIIGFPAYVAMLPEVGIGVVVLSNGPKAARDAYSFHKAIAFHVFDELLRAPGRDWLDDFSYRSRTVREENLRNEESLSLSRLACDQPSRPRQSYVGTFEDTNGRSGTVRVLMRHDRLELRFAGNGAFSADLLPWCGERFRLNAGPGVSDLLGPQFVDFGLDASGHAASFDAFGATFQRVLQ